MMKPTQAGNRILAAIGYSLFYLLAGGGILGAMAIFIAAKMFERSVLPHGAARVP